MGMSESKLERHTQAWIKNKLGVISGKTNHQSIHDLLSKIAPDNNSVNFENKGISAKESNGGQEKFMHGFQLTTTLTSKQAELLRNSIQGKGNLFPFPATINLKSLPNGNVSMTLATTGDYAEAIMKNPRYVAGVNVESYARYALFRGVSQYMARSAIYQFDNQQPKPRVADPKHPSMKDKNDFLLLTQKSYLPSEESIEKLLNDNLTSRDRERLNQEFKEGIDYPLELRSKRERHEALALEAQSYPERDFPQKNEPPRPSAPRPRMA